MHFMFNKEKKKKKKTFTSMQIKIFYAGFMCNDMFEQVLYTLTKI